MEVRSVSRELSLLLLGQISESNIQKLKPAMRVIKKTNPELFDILDDIQKVIQGLYKQEFVETEQSTLTVRELFKFSKIGVIAGCYVEKGKIERSHKVRLLRDGDIVFDGDLESLKRFKEDVKDVAEGFECGVVLKDFKDIRVDDQLISYIIEEKTLL